MKIYTKRGDDGQTDLFGGERVSKDHIKVKAYGEIDCANSALGLAFSTPGLSDRIKDPLQAKMKLLFCAGAEIATSSKPSAQEILLRNMGGLISAQHIAAIEEEIDQWEGELNPLKSFILPCGSDAAARLQWARNSVRKAEVALLELRSSGHEVRDEILKFFNRLSDWLFVLARLANKESGHSDVEWSGSIDS